MTEPWWLTLLREQQAAGFRDVAGAQLSLTLPVDDRLATRLLASRVPASWPIRDIDIRAVAGNQLVVRLSLSKPSFLPAFTIRLLIEEQPTLPSSPILVLRIVSDGIAAVAATALRFLPALPPGLRLEGNQLFVNLAALLEQYGAADALQHLTHLALTTSEGRIVLGLRAAVPERPAAAAGKARSLSQ